MADSHSEWQVFLPSDVVRHVASNLEFNDVLAMSRVCGHWRTALLDSPAEGLVDRRFGLPKAVANRFEYCTLDGRAKDEAAKGKRGPLQRLMSKKSLPGRLPKLVKRCAQWGSSSAALVVAMVSTEVCLGRSSLGGGRGATPVRKGEVWQKYREICEDLGKDDRSQVAYSFEAMAFDLVHLWKRGARLGEKFCQAVLGEAFYCGGGVELSKIPCVQDVEQAVLWLSRAADYGDDVEGDDPMLARSELLLAYIFQDGQEGDSSYSDYMLYGRNDRSVQEAVYWFRRAASHGSIPAQEALRSLYSTGQY